MKDIVIKIVGKRFAGDSPEEEIEFVSDGKMYERAGARYLLYDESEFSGMPGVKTTLKIKDKSIRMKRIGKVGSMDFGSELVFEQGKRFTGKYDTPYGALDIEVLTNRVKTDLDGEGFGRITLDYDVCLSGQPEDRNRIDIEILH